MLPHLTYGPTPGATPDPRRNITHDSALHPALLQVWVQTSRWGGILKSYPSIPLNIVGLGILEDSFQFLTVVSQIDSDSFGVHGIPLPSDGDSSYRATAILVTDCCGTLWQDRACVGKRIPSNVPSHEGLC